MSGPRPRRVGILAGTFDPVHKGHVSFALQAAEAAGLDEVAFLPEIKPRGKLSVTHVSHRIAMLRLAIAGHPSLTLLELPDKQFTTGKSLPRLRGAYPDDRLLMLIGTDVLEHISVWPLARTLLESTGLIVAVRGQKDEAHAHKLIANLPVQPPETHVIVSHFKSVSSRHIREAFQTGKPPEGELATIRRYIGDNWLYQSSLRPKTGKQKPGRPTPPKRRKP